MTIPDEPGPDEPGPGPQPPPEQGPPVNVTAVLREAAAFREHSAGCCSCRDVTLAGDSVAEHLARHFPDPAEQRTAGLGFLVGIALLGRAAPMSRVTAACGEVAAHRLTTGTPIGGLPALEVPDSPEPIDPAPGGTP